RLCPFGTDSCCGDRMTSHAPNVGPAPEQPPAGLSPPTGAGGQAPPLPPATPPTADGTDLGKTAPQPQPVLRVFGPYELLKEIAKGGMGVVFKARDTVLNRVVALKTIRAGDSAGPEELLRFQREARAAAQLAHPNIVPVYETSRHEGEHYFTMPFVVGG